MKQLDMTPALSAMIQKAVGTDVDPSKLAVFETVMLNTKPLPGKRGALFENAVVQPITLKQMADHINNEGGHLPLVSDHELMGAPKGRLFHAGLDLDADNTLELRGLFYLDETEAPTIAKLNAGSLDEVSVAFLSKAFNCSECGWDYFGPEAKADNIWDRTCKNGHQIGKDGVHGDMVGLNQFIETSLVARGAADKPKIVGKSQSKLAPEGLKLLAASGFETDALVVQASIGKKEETNMDLNAAILQVSQLSVKTGELTAQLSAAERDRDGRTTQLSAAEGTIRDRDAEIVTLKGNVAELEKRPDAKAGADLTAALTYLGDVYDRLTVASGKPKVEGDARPKDVAAFTAAIDEMTGKLTSILPVNGKSAPAGGAEDTAKLGFNAAAFTLRK